MKRRFQDKGRWGSRWLTSRPLALLLVTGFGLAGAYLTFSARAVPINGHEVVLDGSGKIIPWTVNPANGYDEVINRAWNYLINDVPDGNGNDRPAYLSHCCVFASTNTPSPWMNNPAGSFAMLIESATRSYAYNGDSRPLNIAFEVANHQLDFGMTPSTWSWGSMPYSTGEAGDLTYNGGGREGVNTIEPDKAAEFAVGLLTLYRYNGNARYRDAAITIANVLAGKIRNGTQSQSPWPFRVNAQTNAIGEQYTAHVLPSIQLFDELVRLNLGNTGIYQTARTTAWNWMMTFPMQNNVWTQYFEDVFVQSDYRYNLNQLIPMNTARYLMEHPEYDPNWQSHVRGLITWVENNFAVQEFGANAIGEQVTYNLTMGSHTARYASVNAMLYEKTGDQTAKEKAYRAFNWATYLTRPNGMVLYHDGIDEFWFTDGYGDYIKHFIAGMGAVPEWAPANQNRMTRTTSVVKSVTYGANTITYTTADTASQEVLRLNANPANVTAGGQVLPQRSDLNQQGWTYDATNKILRIRHDSAANVQINTSSQPSTPPAISFSAAQSTVISGSSTTLNWSSTNATSCSGTGGINGWAGTGKPVSGSFNTGNLTANQTYSLSCSGPGGTTNAAPVTVTVTAVPPPVDTEPPTVTMAITGLTVNPTDTTIIVRTQKSVAWRPQATDNAGAPTIVYRVNNVVVTLTNGSYVFGNGTTASTRNGDYALQVVATDASGNRTTKDLLVRLRHPDIDRSGIVNILDVGVMTRYWNQANTAVDLTVDNTVNILDIGVLTRSWNSTQ